MVGRYVLQIITRSETNCSLHCCGLTVKHIQRIPTEFQSDAFTFGITVDDECKIRQAEMELNSPINAINVCFL